MKDYGGEGRGARVMLLLCYVKGADTGSGASKQGGGEGGREVDRETSWEVGRQASR